MTSTEKRSLRNYHDVIKSENDKRVYRAFVLHNGLKVLVASDPFTHKSSASLSVAVGSMNDPQDIPGLAHLCEHMLFIETNAATVHKEQAYSKFISEHGGSCNAFTTRDQTNYHFDISASVFLVALSRFSKFFTTTPAFSEEALEKEIKIINSEHENNLTNEAWRKMAVEACTARPGHHFGNFSTGNYDTLWLTPKQRGINVLERLRDFHKENYSASIMSLVVLGKEPATVLEDLVVTLFSGVKSLDKSIPKWSEHPYGPDECQKWIDIFPMADVRDLYLCFPMPDSRPWYKTFPHGYLSNLLGHKGHQSLFSVLSRKMWVNNIYINSSVPARGFGYFTIGFQLTVEGLNNIEDIIEWTFKYIAMLKKEGPQEYFWTELKKILEIQFRFQEPDNPIDFVQRTSNLLHVYPMTSVLSVGYFLDNYDEAVILKFLNCLQPDFCRVMTIAKINEACSTTVEKWYGVRHRIRNIAPETVLKWKNASVTDKVSLPLKNLFIASRFEIKPESTIPEKVPLQIHADELGKVWYYQDELKVPKAFIRLEVFSFLPMTDPTNFNSHHIMCMMLKKSLAEELYGASIAGLTYDVKGTMYGIEITVDGNDEKLGILIETIIERLLVFHVHPSFYQAAKSYENGLKNATNRQPHAQVPYYLSLLMREKRFTTEDLMCAFLLEKSDIEQIEHYQKLFMMKIKLECLMYGNISKLEAITLSQRLFQKFKSHGTTSLSPTQAFRLREVTLEKGASYVYKKELQNETQCSCCALLFQIGTRNHKENILLELLDQIIYEPCFSQLRNKEQLGYIVRSSVRKSNGTQGLLIVVQGILKPDFVHKKIESFLESFTSKLSNMGIEELNRHKAAVQLRRKDQPKNIFKRANRLWNNEIYTREYDFDRNTKELEFLAKLNSQQLTSFYKKYFDSASCHRKCIAVHLKSKEPNVGNISDEAVQESAVWKNVHYQEVCDITSWKSRMALSAVFSA